MHKSSFTTISSTVSTIATILGTIFFFIYPVVTIVCAIISLINSIIQVFLGDQNNLSTEFFTFIVAAIIALLLKKSVFSIIAFALCLCEAIMSILGWIYIFIVFIKKF